MKNRPEALRIVEPLDSPRLDRADYWKGVGTVALLDEENKIVSLRISRHVKGKHLEEAVKRMETVILDSSVECLTQRRREAESAENARNLANTMSSASNLLEAKHHLKGETTN